MVGLLADIGNVHFPDLLSVTVSGPSIGLSGPVGLGDPGSGSGVGLGGGIGFDFNAGSGESVGLTGGIGLFA
jgi:hypothetical protein